MKILYKILFICLFVAPSICSYATDGILPEQKIRFVQCYPNPATTSVNFETSNVSDKNLILTVYNFIGKKVEEVKLSTNKINIPLDNYYRGLYVYQLRNKQGQLIESGKFQIIK